MNKYILSFLFFFIDLRKRGEGHRQADRDRDRERHSERHKEKHRC